MSGRWICLFVLGLSLVGNIAHDNEGISRLLRLCCRRGGGGNLVDELLEDCNSIVHAIGSQHEDCLVQDASCGFCSDSIHDYTSS